MPFKKLTPSSSLPDSPDKLFRSLPRRKIPDVLPHQQNILSLYAKNAVNIADVALQLPTGSGKTLVGLLIAEWRRRRDGLRTIYVCPTRQLVNQVVEQANDKYGIEAIGFTGSKKNYSPNIKSLYQSANSVAVTTYSSIFNTSPFFSDADLIILDDAHAAENYISSMWSFRVERANENHLVLHKALRNLLKSHIEPGNFSRLCGTVEFPADRAWVDKIPSPTLQELAPQIIEICDAHVEGSELSHAWSLVRDRLFACHLYLSASEILVRPLLPPTWTHQAFNNPQQRIYMSATLSSGGDLERITGRRSIMRLPIPEGWDRQGVGRRLFLFPGMSLKNDDVSKLQLEFMKHASRSLVLVPNESMRAQVEKNVSSGIKFPVFGAEQIEISKKPFVNSHNAVAVVANRYDGIDFPGEECRLLFIEGLPTATNSQERFLTSRMGANVLLNERIQTRVLQAIGRCTRSLEDYSAVVISGEELPDYLANMKRRKYLHPELQAELKFGIEQSMGAAIDDFKEYLNIFLLHQKEWEDVDAQIIDERANSTQEEFPGVSDLRNAVAAEIDWQSKIWQKDFEGALSAAEKVLGHLKSSELRGYRALWHYLAGSSARYGAQESGLGLDAKARSHFSAAKNAATGIPWLVSLSRFDLETASTSQTNDPALMDQIERIEAVLADLGTFHDGKFAQRERQILEGLNNSDKFEEAQKQLGIFMGFSAGNQETDGAPDPWWISGKICLVFEDYAAADDNSALSVTKARQAESHPKWMRDNVQESVACEIYPVIVGPISRIKKGAIPHAKAVGFWPLSDFRSWSENAVSIIRSLRTTFVEPGDLVWRAYAAEALDQNGLSMMQIFSKVRQQVAAEKLETVL